jgi:hypothetical protein
MAIAGVMIASDKHSNNSIAAQVAAVLVAALGAIALVTGGLERLTAERVTSLRFRREPELLSTLRVDDVLRSLRKQPKDDVAKSSEALAILRQAGRDTRSRLQAQVTTLGSRANVNLAIGIVATITGLAVMGFAVYAKPDTPLTTEGLLSYLIPRVSLAVFVEIFAFFFLRLYRATLEEMKYVHNELSNAEARFAAASAGLAGKDARIQARLLTALVKTERNFVLEKGATTVELERARLEAKPYEVLARALGAAPKRLLTKRDN